MKVIDLHKQVVDLQNIVNAAAATSVGAKDNIKDDRNANAVSHVENSYKNSSNVSYNIEMEKMMFEEARKMLVLANDELVQSLNDKDSEIKRLNSELLELCAAGRAYKKKQGMLFQPPALKAAAVAAVAAQKKAEEVAAQQNADEGLANTKLTNTEAYEESAADGDAGAGAAAAAAARAGASPVPAASAVPETPAAPVTAGAAAPPPAAQEPAAVPAGDEAGAEASGGTAENTPAAAP